MGQVERNFQQTQKFQLLVLFRHIDNIFVIWTHGEDILKNFMLQFNNFNPNIKFIYEFSEYQFSKSQCQTL